MDLSRDLHGIGFLVDTNCVNARQTIQAMNRLESLAEEEVIELLTAETAQNEMVAGNNSQRTKKAYSFITTFSEITTPEEQRTLKAITAILAPGGVTASNQTNDIDIVFNAGKYMRALITNDGGSKSQPGGILGNRPALKAIGIRVLTPDEALAEVRALIDCRDDVARKWAAHHNSALPAWVGND